MTRRERWRARSKKIIRNTQIYAQLAILRYSVTAQEKEETYADAARCYDHAH
jgi:hypothetical protein